MDVLEVPKLKPLDVVVEDVVVGRAPKRFSKGRGGGVEELEAFKEVGTKAKYGLDGLTPELPTPTSCPLNFLHASAVAEASSLRSSKSAALRSRFLDESTLNSPATYSCTFLIVWVRSSHRLPISMISFRFSSSLLISKLTAST